MGEGDAPLAAWLKRLESLSAAEIDLGLERVKQVLSRLDLDQLGTVIHVAGTNGKGSSVAMLEALLDGTCTLGSYTSPHVHRYNERIRIDGAEVDDSTIVSAFERIEAVRGDVPLTYFEYGTLAAVVVFAESAVDLAILEVGMGGRLDAVNAIEPDAGLITNVSLDHCDWLGEDVESIAEEKAGIMRRNEPIVFGGRQVPHAIVENANRLRARLHLAGHQFDWTRNGNGWRWRFNQQTLDGLVLPALPGEHQLDNASAVLALLAVGGFDHLLESDRINSALSTLRLPGRWHRSDYDERLLFDVAHNPAAAQALVAALANETSSTRTVAVIGLLDDKDAGGIVESLRPVVDEWVAVSALSPRAVPAAELARQVANLTDKGCLIATSIEAALIEAGEIAGARDRILVTGSFYVVGPALEASHTLYSRRTT